jgi:hypothetical protein
MRHLYLVEATPRSGVVEGIAQSKTVVFVDSEMWFNPYVDTYDQHGELWRAQIYLLAYRDRAVPDARIAIWPFQRELVIAAASVDVQAEVVTTCYLLGKIVRSENVGTSIWVRSGPISSR